MFCDQCGCPFYIDERLVATRLLSQKGLFSTERSQTAEAFDVDTQQTVILRVVDSEDPLYVDPLLHAVRALQKIHSGKKVPGIMQLVDGDSYFTYPIRPDEPAAHFMVARKVEGISLTEWIQKNGAISEELAKNWLKQLLNAVDALHHEGYLHRDIKPDNIIVTDDLQLVLVDFDTIFCLSDSYWKTPRIGTGAYMAPEQSSGNPLPTSDLYSIGRTIIEALTGKFPLELARYPNECVVWDREAPRLSKPFTELIDRLANKNLLFRPPAASVALTYLSEVEAIPARKRYWRWLSAPIMTTAAAIFAVSLTIAAVGSFALSQQVQSDSERLIAEGNQLILQGDTREGLLLLEEAVELAPDSEEVRAKLAIAYAFIRDFESAIENYKIALEVEPKNAQYLYEIANVYEEVNLQESIFYYMEAVENSEADSSIQLESLNNLARVYLLTDQLQKAEEVLSRIDTHIEDPITRMTVFKNLGWLNYERANYDIAIEQLNQALEADATFPDPYCLLALIQQHRGEDNYNDRATCVFLNAPPKPEVTAWREELNRVAD
ncbi:tetratricopeptide repeat domain protein [Synechococcus sp. PCC 7335]|nr:tetratricopeptide repeat domain protein [Synechococcus sp. PCC 7335]